MCGGESRAAEVIDVDSGHARLGISIDQDAGQTNAPEGVKAAIPSQAQADKAVYGGTADGTLEGAIQGWNQQKRQDVWPPDPPAAAPHDQCQPAPPTPPTPLRNQQPSASPCFLQM